MLPSLFLTLSVLAGVVSAAPAPGSAHNHVKRNGPIRVELTYNPTPPAPPPALEQQQGVPKEKGATDNAVNNLAVNVAGEQAQPGTGVASEGTVKDFPDQGSNVQSQSASSPSSGSDETAKPAPTAGNAGGDDKCPTGNNEDGPEANEHGDEAITMWGRELLYSAVLEVGTPPQKIEVQLDTGSSDLSIWDGTNCTMQRECASNHPQFKPNDSSTFQRLDNAPEPGLLLYGGGYSTGYWAKDAVSVGGLKVDEQGFLSQTGGMTGYSGMNVTGLLGLGFPNASRGKSSKTNWLGNVINQLPEPIISFFLDHTDFDFDHPEATNHSTPRYGGQMILGGIDEELYEGDITYADVLGKDNLTGWNITLDSFTVNGKRYDQPSTALIDTGTTLVYAPRDVLNATLNEVPGAVLWANRWVMPCNSTLDLSLTFAGREWKVPAKSMFYARDNRSGENMCLLSLFPTYGQYWIVGDVFLKHVYSVFKYDPPQIGFATLKKGLQTR